MLRRLGRGAIAFGKWHLLPFKLAFKPAQAGARSLKELAFGYAAGTRGKPRRETFSRALSRRPREAADVETLIRTHLQLKRVFGAMAMVSAGVAIAHVCMFNIVASVLALAVGVAAWAMAIVMQLRLEQLRARELFAWAEFTSNRWWFARPFNLEIGREPARQRITRRGP